MKYFLIFIFIGIVVSNSDLNKSCNYKSKIDCLQSCDCVWCYNDTRNFCLFKLFKCPNNNTELGRDYCKHKLGPFEWLIISLFIVFSTCLFLGICIFIYFTLPSPCMMKQYDILSDRYVYNNV